MGQRELGRKSRHKKDKRGVRFASTTLSPSWTSLCSLFPAALLCPLNRKEYFPVETPSIALIRELFPSTKPTKKHYTDCKRGFAQKNTLHPQFTLRGEVGALINRTHNYAEVDGRESASSYEFVSAGFRDRRAWNSPKKAGLEQWSRSNTRQKINPKTQNKSWSVKLCVGEALTVFWTVSLEAINKYFLLH